VCASSIARSCYHACRAGLWLTPGLLAGRPGMQRRRVNGGRRRAINRKANAAASATQRCVPCVSTYRHVQATAKPGGAGGAPTRIRCCEDGIGSLATEGVSLSMRGHVLFKKKKKKKERAWAWGWAWAGEVSWAELTS
jgi:hypothetical protein